MLVGISFSVNLDSPISVYEQVKNLIQFEIASGGLKPGDKLPSVRALSSELGINANTVTKAYRELELMEVLSAQRGVGVIVTGQAASNCVESIRAETRARLSEAVDECIAAGRSPKEVRSIVTETIDSKRRPYDTA